MAELEGDMARAVEALRSRRSPPADAQARVLARLEAQLGGGGPSGGDGGLGPASGGAAANGAYAAKIAAATLAMTAGGLLLVKLGVLAVRSFTADPGSEVEPAIVEGDAIASVSIEAEPVVPERVEAEPPRLDAQPDRDPPTAGSKSGRLAAAKPALAEPPPAEPDITAELALIDAARRAGSPRDAIAELAQHARRFPSGTLRDEREALWAIASCELGDVKDAAARTKALAARRPNSPLLDRVAAACPDLEKK